MADYYRAREAFAIVDENGCPRPITPGTLVAGDDPAYKGRANFFEPVADSVARATHVRTETASAAPGELRHVFGSPPKRPAAKKTAPAPAPQPQPNPNEQKGGNADA
jgi:hypothetical protein